MLLQDGLIFVKQRSPTIGISYNIKGRKVWSMNLIDFEK